MAAEDQLELKRVSWTDVFSFTQIFRSFRLAVHPSKLTLAFAAIVLVCLGGFALDFLWSLWGGYVDNNEIRGYFNPATADLRGYEKGQSFQQWKQSMNENRLQIAVVAQMSLRREVRGEFTRFMSDLKPPKDSRDGKEPLKEQFTKLLEDYARSAALPAMQSPEDALKDARKKGESVGGKLKSARSDFYTEMDKMEELLGQAYDKAQEQVKGIADKDEKALAKESVQKNYRLASCKLTAMKVQVERALAEVRGQTIFRSLLEHEKTCVGSAVIAACKGKITDGLEQYSGEAAANGVRPVPADAPRGFIYYVLLAVQGVAWLLSAHFVYGLIFLLWTLAVWALFGGAIHRIAALQAARDEKISIAQALRFSAGKFLSFFTAPLIPLVVVLGLGFLVFLGGLLGNLWGFGAILMGAMFFLSVLLGLVIAFVLLGLMSGFALMYPTIAVEGSDSFDAMSRSFSYVFARPWKAILYGLVAVIYGAICYMFVRFFVFLALASTHAFVKMGVFVGGDRLGGDTNRLDVMWSAPTVNSLHGTWNWSAMTGCETVGAWFMWVYVGVLAAMASAFLIAYASSSATVIYYLLRREVDATDLDDVYVEEVEEIVAPAKAAVEAAPAAAPATPVAPAEPAPSPASEAPKPAGSDQPGGA